MAFNSIPDTTYHTRRQRQTWNVPNELEEYADGSIVPYCRVYRHETNPNADNSGRTEVAVRMSKAIDDIDASPGMMDQIIGGMTHPDDCHPGVQFIVNQPLLIDLAMIRHFRAHGGIALPPLDPARKRQDAFEIVAAEEASQNKTCLAGSRTVMRYLTWQEYKDLQCAFGRGGFNSSSRGGGFTGRGGPSSRRGRGRGY